MFETENNNQSAAESEGTVLEAIAAAPLSIEEKLKWQFALGAASRMTDEDIQFLKSAIQILNFGFDPNLPLRVPAGKNYRGTHYMPAIVAVRLFRLEAYLTNKEKHADAIKAALDPKSKDLDL